MKVLRSFKKLLQSADFFGTTEFFRYKSSENFQSFFGGMISMMITVIVAVFSIQQLILCLSKTSISSSLTESISSIPTFYNLSTFAEGKFMGAIEVPALRHAKEDVRYFDYYLLRGLYELDTVTNETKQVVADFIQLEQCTEKHWQNFPELSDDLKLLNLSRMSCIPQNESLPLAGTRSGNLYKSFGMLALIADCSNPSNDTRRCATGQQYYELFQKNPTIQLQLYFTNYHIAPDTVDYIKVFLDDRYAATFNQNKGHCVQLSFQDFTITTDQSVYFIEDLTSQTGYLVDEYPTVSEFNLDSGGVVAYFILVKSQISKNYQRQFYKIQDVFSFVGGLFGTVCGIFLILKFYNNTFYQISLGSDILQPNSIEFENFLKKYNFFTYLQQSFEQFCAKIGFCKSQKENRSNQKDMNIQLRNHNKQSIKQQDVIYLIERLIFLQSAISVTLEEHQIKGLHLREKFTLTDAKKFRQSADLKEVNQLKLSHQIQNLQKNQAQANQSENHTPLCSNLVFLEAIINRSLGKPNKNASQMRDKHKAVLENIEEISQSSEHQKVQEPSKNENAVSEKKSSAIQNGIVKDLIKIKEEAKQGQRISNKIMNLLSRNSAGLDKNKNQQKETINPVLLTPFQSEARTYPLQLKANQQKVDENAKKEGEASMKPISNKNGRTQKLWKVVRNLIQSSDVFCCTQFFRYKNASSHRTIFGGIVSILICLALGVLFYGRLQSLINKENILASYEQSFSSDPSAINFASSPEGNFMFGVNMYPLEFNHATQRYFDVDVELRTTVYDKEEMAWKQEVKSLPFESCTDNHWVVFPELKSQINNLNYGKLICFPVSAEISVEGKETSEKYSTMEVVIKKCRNQTDPSRPCNQRMVDLMFYYYYMVAHPYFSNTLVSPQNENYLQYSLYDQMDLTLSKTSIANVKIQLSQFIVVTDQSIFPWSDEVQQSGFFVKDQPRFFSIPNPGHQTEEYVRYSFSSSGKSFKYYRSYQKIADFFALIGGIFGIFLFALSAIGSYNSLAYNLSIGSRLFKPDQPEKRLFKKYSFLSFITQSIHSLIESFGFNPEWNSTLEYNKCQEELEQQLDISLLLKRLEFLETSFSAIFEDYEIKGLYLKDKPSLQDAKNQRKAFKLKYRINRLKDELVAKENLEDDFNFIERKEEISANSLMKQNEILFDVTKDDDGKQKASMSELDVFSDCSSESESESDFGKNEEKEEILEELRKLKEEANKGVRTSSMIVDLASRKLSALESVGALRESQNLKTLKSQKSHGVSRAVSVTEFIAEDEKKGVERYEIELSSSSIGRERIMTRFTEKRIKEKSKKLIEGGNE